MDLPISLHDLEFDQIPVQCESPKGARYTRWLRVGMPKIPSRVVESVFFLYGSREDALAGKDPGGTGFVVSTGRKNLRISDGPCFYGVTNQHVACSGGSSVIRLNTADGGVDVLEFGPEDWDFIPGGPDVAVVPLELGWDRFHTASVSIGSFASKPNAGWGSGEELSVGDDVFMLGLFVDYKGLTTNIPSARFGNISMLPVPIEQPTGSMEPSYVVDMHARTGFSGSPVFAFRTFGSDLTKDKYAVEALEIETGLMHRGTYSSRSVEQVRATVHYRTLFKFLGVHWGQFPEAYEIRNDGKIAEGRPNLVTDGSYVRGYSGMTCVIPSWHIMEVLNLPKLEKQRLEGGKRDAEKRRAGPVAESAKATDANPEHKEDFTRLLGEAARKREPKD